MLAAPCFSCLGLLATDVVAKPLAGFAVGFFFLAMVVMSTDLDGWTVGASRRQSGGRSYGKPRGLVFHKVQISKTGAARRSH